MRNPSHDENAGARAGVSISTLAPELFPLISDHLPSTDRSASLLALAMACRRLRDIIIPHILYREVYVEGEAMVSVFVVKLREEAVLTNENDLEKRSLPQSHHIHFLEVNLDYDTINRKHQQDVLRQVRLLVQCGGLLNLESLTIHLNGQSSKMITEIGPRFWNAARDQCPRLNAVRLTGIQGAENFWLHQSGLFRLECLKALRLQTTYTEPLSPDLSTFVSSFTLSYLELRVENYYLTGEPHDAKGLLSLKLPNLSTLILDGFDASQPDLVTAFWLYHFGLRKLVLGPLSEGEWFSGFGNSMLPNLTVFGGSPNDARAILPHVAKRLKTLTLFKTYNAQALYLLRDVAPDGVLPALQSLSIHLKTSAHSRVVVLEGNRWREDEAGRVTETSKRKAARWFDGSYIMSISKAAPNLEELELSGTSRDTLESLTCSLSRLVKLSTLVLSGPVHGFSTPFFESSCGWSHYREWDLGSVGPLPYAPASFEQAARDLGEGCPNLGMVCIRARIGYRDRSTDLACQIIRGDDEAVTDIVMQKTGGMNIEREEDVEIG